MSKYNKIFFFFSLLFFSFAFTFFIVKVIYPIGERNNQALKELWNQYENNKV